MVDFISLEEAADQLDVSESLLRQWVKKGLARASRRGGSYVLRTTEVERLRRNHPAMDPESAHESRPPEVRRSIEMPLDPARRSVEASPKPAESWSSWQPKKVELPASEPVASKPAEEPQAAQDLEGQSPAGQDSLDPRPVRAQLTPEAKREESPKDPGSVEAGQTPRPRALPPRSRDDEQWPTKDRRKRMGRRGSDFSLDALHHEVRQAVEEALEGLNSRVDSFRDSLDVSLQRHHEILKSRETRQQDHVGRLEKAAEQLSRIEQITNTLGSLNVGQAPASGQDQEVEDLRLRLQHLEKAREDFRVRLEQSEGLRRQAEEAVSARLLGEATLEHSEEEMKARLQQAERESQARLQQVESEARARLQESQARLQQVESEAQGRLTQMEARLRQGEIEAQAHALELAAALRERDDALRRCEEARLLHNDGEQGMAREVASAMRQVAERDEVIRHLEAAAEKERHRAEDIEAALQKNQEALRRTRAELEKLQADLRQATVSFEARDQEKAQQVEALAAELNQVRELRDRTEESRSILEDQLYHTTQQLEQSKSRAAKLQDELDQTQDQVGGLLEDLEQAQVRANGLESDLRDAQNRHAKMEAQWRQREEELSQEPRRLKEQVNSLQFKVQMQGPGSASQSAEDSRKLMDRLAEMEAQMYEKDRLIGQSYRELSDLRSKLEEQQRVFYELQQRTEKEKEEWSQVVAQQLHVAGELTNRQQQQPQAPADKGRWGLFKLRGDNG